MLAHRSSDVNQSEVGACGSVVERVPDKNEVEGPIPSTPTTLLNLRSAKHIILVICGRLCPPKFYYSRASSSVALAKEGP